QRQGPHRDRRMNHHSQKGAPPHMKLSKIIFRAVIAVALALAATVSLAAPASALTRWNRTTVTIENHLDSSWPVETAIGAWHRASGLNIVVVNKCPVMNTSCVVL